MKKIFTLIITILIATLLKSQAPQKMSYQAVIRNSSNALVTSHTVGMKISILQGSASGTAVYVETQIPTTNSNGLVTIEIGGGTPVTGTFSGIDWSAGPYFIKSEVDPAGGTSYSITGTSQLLSVPYALYASKAGTSNYNDLTNKPSFRVSNKGDSLFLAGSDYLIIPGASNGTPDNYVLNNIMTGLKIVEKLKPGSFTMTVNQAQMIATNYSNCTKIGEYVVYTKTVSSLDPTPWGAESGTAFTGDHFPSGLQVKFAWKSDGTVYLGAIGTDDEVLATMVLFCYGSGGGYGNSNTMFETLILLEELKLLRNGSLASGIPADADLYTTNFYSSLNKYIFNRFTKPVFRIISSVNLTASPANILLWPPESQAWCPFSGNGTGTGSRSFSLAFTNATNSFVCADAGNDNSNSSYVKLNGSIVAQMSKWYANYYRRPAIYPSSVEISATISWSQASPDFRMAFVGDGVSASNVIQTPAGGLSNNKAPVIIMVPVY
jgi:hypothetical protein